MAALAFTAAACQTARAPINPTSPAALAGWSTDDHAAALQAFLVSCPVLTRRDSGGPLGGIAGAGDTPAWQRACRDAAATSPGGARTFLERSFTIVAQETGPDGATGLFTGYYEPLLYGSRNPSVRFRYPLHRRPANLGRRKGHPLLSRASIDSGTLARERLELAWVDDPVAKFFLQIQGSGQVQLDTGELIRVGYADQNGHPYRAIGRDLIDSGVIPREQMSMQAIDHWLRTANPGEAQALMHKNPSYVFFRELGPVATTPGPIGAMSVPVTPGRSLAVDRSYVPLGSLVWVDTTIPTPAGERALRRLMVAQDVGGAIKGPVRGDVFWGAGPQAEYVAGRMKQPGRLWRLVPRG